MDKQLEGLLYTYLGELMNERDSTYAWIEKDAIRIRMNAVYLLLGIDKKELTFFDTLKGIIKNP